MAKHRPFETNMRKGIEAVAPLSSTNMSNGHLACFVDVNRHCCINATCAETNFMWFLKAKSNSVHLSKIMRRICHLNELEEVIKTNILCCRFHSNSY